MVNYNFKRKNKSYYKELWLPLRREVNGKKNSTITDLEQIFTNKKTQIKKMKKSDFKNSVEVQNKNYFKFENEGDYIIITSCEAEMRKDMNGNTETVYSVVSDIGEEYTLPNHHNLSRRLKQLIIIGYDFSQGALIEYKGEMKHPTDKLKTIKNYEVKTK